MRHTNEFKSSLLASGVDKAAKSKNPHAITDLYTLWYPPPPPSGMAPRAEMVAFAKQCNVANNKWIGNSNTDRQRSSGRVAP
jgi:hypothetical protein